MYKKIVREMKSDTWEQAYDKAIKIKNKEGLQVGKLVPIGNWILSDQIKIQQMSEWRQKAMKMFFTQFISRPELTFEYIKNLSIKEEGRILFIILNNQEKFIGHIGISNINYQVGELDNLMRGEEGGDPSLIYYSEISLLNWCFNVLKVKKILVRVISYNWLVIDLHESVGFIITEKLHLFKRVDSKVTYHDEVQKSETNVGYMCIKMCLQADKFNSKVPWVKIYD